MPANIAMEIARAPDGDVQQALAEAYGNKLLPGNQILAIRRIILQRNQRRKKSHSALKRRWRRLKSPTVIDGMRPRKPGSHQTLRWSETDSNRWPLAERPRLGPGEPKKASSGSSTPRMRLGPQGDRGAKPCSLLRERG